MTMSRTFRGYFNRAKSQTMGLGLPRRILMIELDPVEAAALDDALGPRPHRSQNIPITFVVGETAETLKALRDEIRADEPPAADLGQKILARLDELVGLARRVSDKLK